MELYTLLLCCRSLLSVSCFPLDAYPTDLDRMCSLVLAMSTFQSYGKAVHPIEVCHIPSQMQESQSIASWFSTLSSFSFALLDPSFLLNIARPPEYEFARKRGLHKMTFFSSPLFTSHSLGTPRLAFDVAEVLARKARSSWS